MKKPQIILINREYANRENLFLKDSKCDLYVILNNKIYPFHKNFIEDIGYFAISDSEGGKVHLLDSRIDQKIFLSLMGFFYGKQIRFVRDWSIQILFNAIRLLQIPRIERKILLDIKNNFDEYGFFLLLSLSQKYKIKWLKDQCFEDLILMGFQQLNYNRYDLFQVDQPVFEEIIQLHETLKINGNISGLRNVQIKKIIKQYSEAKSIKLDLEQILVDSESTKTSSRESDNFHQDSSRSPDNEWNSQEVTWEQTSMKVKSCNVKKVMSQKKQEVDKLHIINSDLQEKSNKMISQVKDVLTYIHKNSLAQSTTISECIDQRFKKFQNACEQQNVKFQILKKQIARMEPKQKRLSIFYNLSQNQKQAQPKLSCKEQEASQKNISIETQRNKLFMNMPKLDRDLDD